MRIIRGFLMFVGGMVVFWTLVSLLFRTDEHKKVKGGVIAEVHVYGPIRTDLTNSPWGKPDADSIAKRLHEISEDDNVKAILLRINSPGGTVGGVQEIYTEIMRCKAKGKTIVASLADVAASGGYYLASAADRIVADPGTITGSIGVIMQFGNLEGLFQKVGLRMQVIKSGEHKDIGSPARPMTPEERKMLQATLDDAYDQFFEAVAKGRKMDPARLRALADGRVFTGRQAFKVGLVDEMGNREDAIQAAIKLAKMPPHPPVISDEQKPFSSLMRRMSTQSALDSFQDRLGGPRLEYTLQ